MRFDARLFFISPATQSRQPHRVVLLATLSLAAVAAPLNSPAWAQSATGISVEPAGAVAASAAMSLGQRRQQVLTVQVLLDRARFSPGVIDGLPGGNTTKAVRAFQRAQQLPDDGKIDGKLMRELGVDSAAVLRRYAITQDDAAGPFVPAIPEGMEAQAELERMAYTSPLELLAEKFHMSEGLLQALNPGANFARAGTEILVAEPGQGALGGEVARVEVDKGEGHLRAYDDAGKLLAAYPATIGSTDLPSPSGTTKVRAIAPDPAYYFDPKNRSWGPDRRLKLAPGPNNPVGGTWIDLEHEGYGIHGTPDPARIGKTASHGCVRLTNWDAEELAAAIKPGAIVEFVDG